MQKCAAGPVNGAYRRFVQRHHPLLAIFFIISIIIEQSAPPTANPHHGVTFINGAHNHSFDAGIQTGNVAAAGEYAYFHWMAPCDTEILRTQKGTRQSPLTFQDFTTTDRNKSLPPVLQH
jgi:hypothetical protein